MTWEQKFDVDKNNKPKANNYNAQLIVDNDGSIFRPLAFDQLKAQAMWMFPPPWCRDVNGELDEDEAFRYPLPVVDADASRAMIWIYNKYNVALTPAQIGLALEVGAYGNPFDPVRGYLSGLSWDRIPRIDTWLTDYLGVKDTPLVRAMGAKWLISAVARIYQPGCQADHVLVLEGQQGIGKSSVLRALTGAAWFTDVELDVSSKDGTMMNAGVWIRELSELAGMRKAEIERVKAFLTRRVDKYRPPYGRHNIEIPRRMVFAATTNPTNYLNDPTGARRFWPVWCAKADVVSIADARDQLWAEARERYSSEEKWWLTDSEMIAAAAAEQSDRNIEDPWFEAVERYARGRDYVVINEALTALAERGTFAGPDRMKWSPADGQRVGAIFRSMGFTEKRRTGNGHDRVYRYYKATASNGRTEPMDAPRDVNESKVTAA